jgi:hypothetical protein
MDTGVVMDLYRFAAALVVALLAFWGIIERRQGRERYLVTQSAAMTWTVVWSILGVTGLVLKSVSGGMSPSMFRAGMMISWPRFCQSQFGYSGSGT